MVLSTLPWVALCITLRIALEVSPLQFSGLFSSETVTPFTTVSMFVIAIMLGGIMEDYKEAERLPAEMVSALDSVSEKINFCELASLKFVREREEKREKGASAHSHGSGGGGGGGGGGKAAAVVKVPAAPAAVAQPCCCCKRVQAEADEIEVLDSKHEHAELLSYVVCLCVAPSARAARARRLFISPRPPPPPQPPQARVLCAAALGPGHPRHHLHVRKVLFDEVQ